MSTNAISRPLCCAAFAQGRALPLALAAQWRALPLALAAQGLAPLPALAAGEEALYDEDFQEEEVALELAPVTAQLAYVADRCDS